jgi:hypothetical protein
MEWEWYTDINTKTLFIHCLLRANWKPGRWKGINYDAGEFITSLPTLAEESGLTIQQVRTSLDKLISTGEITSKTTDSLTGKKLTKNRIITINNWDVYQGDNSQKNSQNNNQTNSQATGKQQASNSRYKKCKNNKEIKEENNMPLAETENDLVSSEELFGVDSDVMYERFKRGEITFDEQQ